MANENKLSARKTLAWVYGAVKIFTAISIVGPIILDRLGRKDRNKQA